ncbi:FIST C-terminal domain-containing protein [Paraglaciecola aquimarina]|uniref:FIST C-terminal domain-containing protein n=1 Tax=Paraglaciecola aquimarina TaxID=1235557 RepID=A0ABU3SSF4_9ALTE|nr:FIST C-terminal domain-containing protein [Paraglaciecola aquimarina]MDU0352951.1 FIST C-terminal domain-containing protein [Paraglaciecola aquimarina]
MSLLFGSVEYSTDIASDNLTNLLESVLLQAPSGILILCCEQTLDKFSAFDAFLKSIPIPIFGGIFPSLVLDNETKEQGIIFVPIRVPLDINIFQDLERAQEFEFCFNLTSHQSLMVLVDGLARNIDHALNQIFLQFGQTQQVFGGGAGSLSFEHKPCLITNQGLLQDAMVVIALQLETQLAIGHGWTKLAGPYLANQVDDNRILQLNFQPALAIYKQVVEQHDGRLFSEHDFFEIAKTYPFGMERLDDDVLVRDPVTVEQESLVCVGKVPENTMLYVLDGQHTKLIDAAVQAVQKISNNMQHPAAMIFDCISRKLFLEDDFNAELSQISAELSHNEVLFGALVLGEIASGQSGAIHFHNKTAVVAMFEGK